MKSTLSRKLRIVCIASLVAVFVVPVVMLAQGKGQGVEVRLTSAPLVETEPGRIITVSFLVTSKTDGREEFAESLDLPANWQAVTVPASLVLEPGERQVRVIAFQVPASAPAASYEVTYSVRSQRDYAIQDFDSVKIQVLPVDKLAMIVEEKPDTVIAGDEYEVKLRIVNRGNSDTDVEVTATSSEDHPLTVDPARMSLASGKSQVVVIKVRTDERLKVRARDSLQVTAQAVTLKKEKVTVRECVVVEILPRMVGEIDLYHRIPAKVEVSTVGEDGEIDFQAELSGEGSLDEDGLQRVDFLLRAPNVQGGSIFALRDEYRLNYQTQNMDLRLGDQSYSLSYLTDYYRYGRGVGLALHRGNKTQLGAHYLQSRWGAPESSQTAVFVGHRLSDRLGLRLNLLDRDRDAPLSTSDKLRSVQAFVRPSSKSRLEVEYGDGESSRDGGVDDTAYRMSLDGDYRGIYYTLGKIHAGPDYFGYYSDADYTSGTLAFPIAGQLRCRLSSQEWKQNLSLDPALGLAPHEDFRQAGLTYSLPSGMNLSLDYNRFHRRDLLDPAEFDFKENALRLGIGRPRVKSSIQAYIDSGRQRDLLDGDTDSTMRYSLFYSLRPSARQYFSLYGQVGSGRPEQSRLLGGTNTLGLYGNWRPNKKLSLALNYIVNAFDTDNQWTSRQAYFTATYGQRDKGYWTLKLRHISHPMIDNNSSFYLSYTTYWGIPVAKKKSVGAIRGRIFDLEANGKPGIPRVIVTASGAAVATNAQGEFVFQSVPPGTYSLSVQKSGIGMNRVTREKSPLPVEVKGGESTQVDIAVIRSARVHGKVAILSYQPAGRGPGESEGLYVEGPGGPGKTTEGAGSTVEVGGLGDALIELTNGEETIRRLTDNRGGFFLDDLRPGKWTLRIYDHNLPDMHYVETSEMEVELLPGDEESVVFKVLPRLRAVKVIERGTLNSSEQ